MHPLECDVAIIGAGSAGLSAERAARGAGARTLLIDDRYAGTTCATVGCMPSKLLLAAAHAAHGVRTAGVFGIRVPTSTIDAAAVMARVRALRDEFAAGALASIAKIPEANKIRATASFLDAGTLALDDGRHVVARSVVVATGSRPIVPKAFEALGALVLTNENIFELPVLPASVAVVGAGPLGLELAQAMARLGVEVAVFDKTDALGGVKDPAVVQELRRLLGAEFAIHLGVDIAAVRDGGLARVSWSGSSAGERAFERVLVATGRAPSLAHLGLEKTGLAIDAHGIPVFDPTTMQCGQGSIFLAGDADHDRPVLHEASRQGALAGRNAAAFPEVVPAHRGPAFSIMFTDPPVAVIGEPPAADSISGTASYRNQGRARVENRAGGVARLYARPDGQLTGAELVGPGMDHVGHLLAWAVDRKERAADVWRLPFYHPTLEEGIKPALREICDATEGADASQFDVFGVPGV